MTETVMIPIKNKIFFIWAENHKFILERQMEYFKLKPLRRKELK